jgi:hypothetical protein
MCPANDLDPRSELNCQPSSQFLHPGVRLFQTGFARPREIEPVEVLFNLPQRHPQLHGGTDCPLTFVGGIGEFQSQLGGRDVKMRAGVEHDKILHGLGVCTLADVLRFSARPRRDGSQIGICNNMHRFPLLRDGQGAEVLASR